MQHAKLSPSSAVRWMTCPGSVVLSEGVEEETSKYAAEGTLAHALAESMLKGEPFYEDTSVDMYEEVEKYTNAIRTYAEGNTLLVEQRLSIEHLTGEEGAKGTADAVIIADDELQVHDLKYGMGVKVEAEENEQLMIYALAAIEAFEALGPFTRVRLVIHQVRLNSLSEWDCSIEHLQEFAAKVRVAAAKVATCAINVHQEPGDISLYLKPTEDACKFCKAKATCPALRDFALGQVSENFDDLDIDKPLVPQLENNTRDPQDNAQLGNLLQAFDLIETWMKAIRARVEVELQHGNDVPGWKLVQGRKGSRAWTEPLAVEQVFKSMRLKVEQMYDFKLISPTTAEKLLKDTPKRWSRVVNLISQSEGAPSVAPASDKRPALKVESFANLEEEALA